VHLAAVDPWPDHAAGTVVGRSCHDAGEVRRAVGEGATYVTVSPVHPTSSKPGYGPPLGTDGLVELVGLAGTTPVYALGGVTPAEVGPCLDAGAHGVAVMGRIMAADNPGEAAAELVAALATATGAR
jgi:thiamine-phosphate diphosphorylase